MLLHVLPSAIDAVFAGGRPDDALAAIDGLLRAHHAGKHLVLLDRSSARRLREAELSKRAKGALQAILSTRSETGDLHRRLKAYMEIGAGPDFDGCFEQRGTSLVLKQDIHWFEQEGRTLEPVLAAEDATDAELYMEIGRAALFAWHRARRTPLMEPRHGGGSRLAEAFLGAIDAGRLAFAIADSDRDAPGAAVDGTARALRDAVSRRNGYLFDLGDPSQNKVSRAGEPCPPASAIIMHVRMLENLVPLHIYEHTVTPAGVERLRRLQRMCPGVSLARPRALEGRLALAHGAKEGWRGGAVLACRMRSLPVDGVSECH